MAGAHLDDGYLVFRSQAEQRLGHPYVVVEVALGVEHVVLLLQHGGDELLGGRLAVGAGNADDGNLELAAVFAGQVLEGLEAVVDLDDLPLGRLGGGHSLVNDGVGAALFQSL